MDLQEHDHRNRDQNEDHEGSVIVIWGGVPALCQADDCVNEILHQLFAHPKAIELLRALTGGCWSI
jgi:hypothetical protein